MKGEIKIPYAVIVLMEVTIQAMHKTVLLL